MTERKNFNYRDSTVAQIAEHFKHSSRQLIYAVRKSYKDNQAMSEKIEAAYLQYRIDKIMND